MLKLLACHPVLNGLFALTQLGLVRLCLLSKDEGCFACPHFTTPTLRAAVAHRKEIRESVSFNLHKSLLRRLKLVVL